MKILKLIKNKNRCLNKYLRISNEFLEEITQGDFSSLDVFENAREAILKAVNIYDKKITLEAVEIKDNVNTQEIKSEIIMLEKNKNHIIQEIFDTDEKLINIIDEEKNKLKDDLNKISGNRNSIGKFKSKWLNESGIELDNKL